MSTGHHHHRRQERFHTTGTVTVSFREGWFGKKILSGHLVDVSAGGLQVKLTALVPKGRRVKMVVALGLKGAEAALYHLSGRIAWSRAGKDPSGECFAGIELRPDRRDDSSRWNSIIYEALKEQFTQ